MDKKILVVSNSIFDLTLMKSALNEYDVFKASKYSEVLKVLKTNKEINLIVLDIEMAENEGFKTLESISNKDNFPNLCILILTNNDKLENEIKGLKLGADDYLRKPIQKESLRVRVDLHLELLRAEQTMGQEPENLALTFDMIFEQAPIGIAISYYCGKPDNQEIIRFNKTFQKITGRTRNELITLGWEKITHPDDLPQEVEGIKKLKSGEIKIFTTDKRYIKPDGSIVWVHMILAPLSLTNSKQVSCICLIQDITNRKEIEKALNESERSKSVFLSQLPGLAYRCYYDRDWTMQYVSDGCYNLTGYLPESLLYNRDLSYNDLIAPE